jgi:FMN phosphatase YigB (HAD superfamily)
MIRAIFFDFYSVWTPDKFAEYIQVAAQRDPGVAAQLTQAVEQYYLGFVEIGYVADMFGFKLNDLALPPGLFELKPADISPALIDFMRNLHGHFLKLGVLGNFGKQEQALLSEFNAQNQLFEVIMGSVTVGISIYSKDVFVKALQAIGEPPASCLVVSGNDDYLRFAGSCGIQVLRFEGFAKLEQSLNQVIGNS